MGYGLVRANDALDLFGDAHGLRFCQLLACSDPTYRFSEIWRDVKSPVTTDPVVLVALLIPTSPHVPSSSQHLFNHNS